MTTSKKSIHFTTDISIYMSHKHFEVLWSFILHILQRSVLSLKNSHYAYIPPYMHKTLLTLGNEKEQWQIKFYKNCWARWFSCRWLKISECSRHTQERLTKHTSTYWSKFFHVHQVRNLSFWHTYVNNVFAYQ